MAKAIKQSAIASTDEMVMTKIYLIGRQKVMLMKTSQNYTKLKRGD